MKRLCLILLCCVQPLLAANHVNILVYHHVSESTPASTSVSPAQFRGHLQWLKDQGFTVVDLRAALTAIQSEEPLPDHAVAITFDDGYGNIYDNAWPLLKEFNYPFTVFIATDAIDQKYGDMLSWDQIREMHANGVTIANHSSDHAYLVRHPIRDNTWLANTRQNIEHAQTRLTDELGKNIPRWFAYPYGEFNNPLRALLKDMNYIGFAQHSGGLWHGTDMQSIPRFAAAGIYANTDTLLVKLKSKPMPVDETLLPDMLTSETKPPLSATINDTSDLSRALNCFVDGQWQDAEWQDDNRFTLVSASELSEGRHRYNCTSHSRSSDFYYWFSKPWLVYPDQR